MSDLSAKTIIAIGCGTPDGQVSNGFAAVRAFLAAGARVCIVDHDPVALEHARAALDAEDRFGGDAAPGGSVGEGERGDHLGVRVPQFTMVTADVGDEDSLAAAFAHCAEVLGPPTVLHYNVGIVVNGGLDTLDAEDFRTALDVNLIGAFRAMKLALGYMREADGGSIITVSSVGGLRHMGYDYPAYAASKAGLIALTKAIALQHAEEGIRANSIAPGLIETPLIHGSISGHYASVEEMLAARHALSPTGRMGRPADVADLAVFLASDAAAYINATVIPVDGGLVHRAGGPDAQD